MATFREYLKEMIGKNTNLSGNCYAQYPEQRSAKKGSEYEKYVKATGCYALPKEKDLPKNITIGSTPKPNQVFFLYNSQSGKMSKVFASKTDALAYFAEGKFK